MGSERKKNLHVFFDFLPRCFSVIIQKFYSLLNAQIMFHQKRLYLKQLRSYGEKTFYGHPFGAIKLGHKTKKLNKNT